jgi:mannose-6-phosphate isomerase-like protein (cupin superfamily)
LAEIADIGQPFVFKGDEISPEVAETFAYGSIDHIVNSTGGTFSVAIKDSSDYRDTTNTNVAYISAPLRTAAKLVETDTRSRLFSDCNNDFIEESGAKRMVRKLDEALCPRFTVQTTYDLVFGAHGTTTPLHYHTDHAYYVAVTRGVMHIKFVPPNHSESLHEVRDYENFEFRSRVDIWNVQEQYKRDMETVRVIDAEVNAGNIVFIPARWWFSIKFASAEGEPTTAFTYSYNTIISRLANAPSIIKHWLQNANTTIAPIKKVTKGAAPAVEPPAAELPEERVAADMAAVVPPSTPTPAVTESLTPKNKRPGATEPRATAATLPVPIPMIRNATL